MRNHFFTKEEEKQIIYSIREAEKNTSGEIRLHIEKKCKGGNVLDRATNVFHILKMNKTAQQNGVLFYLATKDKQFSVIGDKGINEKVPDDFWEEVKKETIEAFKNGDFCEGLSKSILKAGEKLKAFFPYQQDDKNELSDEISFGKKK